MDKPTLITALREDYCRCWETAPDVCCACQAADALDANAQHVVLEIDGEEIAALIVPHIPGELQRRGLK